MSETIVMAGRSGCSDDPTVHGLADVLRALRAFQMSNDRRRRRRFGFRNPPDEPESGNEGDPDGSGDGQDEYATTDSAPGPTDRMYQRLTRGDLEIIIGAMRGAVRSELRLFLEDKWSAFGKYTAKGVWALVVAALVWLAIVVTHGWKTPPA